MARYKLTSEGHFNDKFTLISVQAIQRIAGEDVEITVNKNQELFSCLVPAGAVVEVPDSMQPGEHMEPVDAAARAVFAKYVKPQYHNTLDGLPKTMDMRSTEELMRDAFLAAMAVQSQREAGTLSPAPAPKLPLARK